MLPYIEQPSLSLGPVTIHAFGVLVAAGIWVALEVFRRRASRAGLDLKVGGRLTTWVLIWGLAGAHLFDRLLYNPDQTLADPLSLFAFWDGISSYGGLIGGAIGAVTYLLRHPQGPRTWQYVDAIAYALPFAFVLGRLGCFLAYDHVGAPTDLFWGQTYVDGVVRHNMGLEEALYWALLCGVVIAVGRERRRPGTIVGLVALLYAPGRFFLDFLRISDERHAGLLVSQYASVAVAAIGAYILWRIARMPVTEPASV